MLNHALAQSLERRGSPHIRRRTPPKTSVYALKAKASLVLFAASILYPKFPLSLTLGSEVFKHMKERRFKRLYSVEYFGGVFIAVWGEFSANVVCHVLNIY